MQNRSSKRLVPPALFFSLICSPLYAQQELAAAVSKHTIKYKFELGSQEAPRVLQLQYAFDDLAASAKFSKEALPISADEYSLLENAITHINYAKGAFLHFESSCKRAEEENLAAAEIAQILNRANIIELAEMSSFYEKTYNSFSAGLQSIIDSRIRDYGASVVTEVANIDYVSLGADHPDVLQKMLDRTCATLSSAYDRAHLRGTPQPMPITASEK